MHSRLARVLLLTLGLAFFMGVSALADDKPGTHEGTVVKVDIVLNDSQEEEHHHAERKRKERGDQQKLLRVAQAVQDLNRGTKQTLHAAPESLDIPRQTSGKAGCIEEVTHSQERGASDR